jgi:hypothetical protein
MQIAFKGRFVLLWTTGLICFFLLLRLASTNVMDHLDNPFTIEIAGASIAKISDNDEELTQAATGDDAAVFTLKNSRLQSGDWILGRYFVEDRSLLPKKLLWVKAESDGYRLHPVTAEKDGEIYKLSFNGAHLSRS